MATKYELQKEGTITIVNNFRFEDNTLDHAWKSGRLCLVLFSDDEYEYVVSMTSYVKNKYIRDNFYYITDDTFLYYYKNRYIDSTLKRLKNKRTEHNSLKNNINKTNVIGYIDLRDVYKIPVAYRDEIGKLTPKAFSEILRKLYVIQQTNSNDEIMSNAISRK